MSTGHLDWKGGLSKWGRAFEPWDKCCRLVVVATGYRIYEGSTVHGVRYQYKINMHLFRAILSIVKEAWTGSSKVLLVWHVLSWVCFVLPDCNASRRSLRNGDVSWIGRRVRESLTKEDRRSFSTLQPSGSISALPMFQEEGERELKWLNMCLSRYDY